jgi:hypothetical protein
VCAGAKLRLLFSRSARYSSRSLFGFSLPTYFLTEHRILSLHRIPLALIVRSVKFFVLLLGLVARFWIPLNTCVSHFRLARQNLSHLRLREQALRSSHVLDETGLRP